MAGFPVRSLDEWQRVLVEAGLQLAICNQHPVRKLVSHTLIHSLPTSHPPSPTSSFPLSLLHFLPHSLILSLSLFLSSPPNTHPLSVSLNTHRDGCSTGLMEREVVRLVTPGTLAQPLDQSANYLLCLAPGSTTSLGLAWADISTAELKVPRQPAISQSEGLLHRLT